MNDGMIRIDLGDNKQHHTGKNPTENKKVHGYLETHGNSFGEDCHIRTFFDKSTFGLLFPNILLPSKSNRMPQLSMC
jgi:hypothetical protein